MDPVTHALAGAVIATVSGNEPAVSNAVYLSSMVGAVAPDLDIVYKTRGELNYLKHHRGVSHSLPGIIVLSLLVAVTIFHIFPSEVFTTLLLFAFLGALSHVLLDVLNSYGAMALWPFSSQKINLGILNIFDPILLALMLSVFIFQVYNYVFIGAVLIYLLIRYLLIIKVRRVIQANLGGSATVLPSVISIWSWHFLIEKNEEILVGEIKFLSWLIVVKKSFSKQKNNPVIKAALDSRLGRLFKEFTPLFFVSCVSGKEVSEVKFIDLRYYIRDDFMHSATGIFDKDNKLIKGLFHPYSKNRKITISN